MPETELLPDDIKATETGKSWEAFGALFGWQLYGWTFDAKATFVVPGSSEHLYINKVQRESMEAAWNRRAPVAEGSAEDMPSVFLQEQQGGQILSTVKTGGLSAQDAMQAIKRLHEHLGQEIDRAKTDCPAQRAVPEQESSAATRARDSVALEWARKLDAAATRHDIASTEAERKAASRDINDLILDSERMVQIARALLIEAKP